MEDKDFNLMFVFATTEEMEENLNLTAKELNGEKVNVEEDYDYIDCSEIQSLELKPEIELRFE